MRAHKGIYLRGNVYWLAFQKSGVRKFISLETSDDIEAIRRAAEIRKTLVIPKKSDFNAAVERYIAFKRGGNIFTARTERLNRNVLSAFGRIMSGPLADITRSDAERYYRILQARVAETTAQIHIRAIRAFFSWCVTQQLCSQNPAKKIVLARVERPARLQYCTPAERDKLIANAPNDDLKFILLAGFHAGLRKNEIIQSRVHWFNLQPGGSIHICSTPSYRLHANEEHFVPITKTFRKFLTGYLKGKSPEDFALKPQVKQGRGEYRYDFARPFNDFTTSRGMRWVTAHVMRHTFASIAVQRGVSIFKVARWLGDGVEVVEKHYAHLSPQDSDVEKII